MTVFRKFEVCASYEHLWLNRHLRQAAKRYLQSPYHEKQLSFRANEENNPTQKQFFFTFILLLVKTGLNNGVSEPLCNQGKIV